MPEPAQENLVDIYLDIREWNTFDCKRARVSPAKICETICAFANTGGGTIVIGLEDPDKEVQRKERLVGISEGEDNISEILNAIEKDFAPPLINVTHREIEIINREGHPDRIVVLEIPKSNEIHSLKNGDTYRRDGRTNHKMGVTEITNLRYEKGSSRYEDELADGLTASDLDQDLLQHLKQDMHSESSSALQFLADLGLTTRRNHSRALCKSAVLLFGRNPSTQLRSKCGIKITHYYGEERNYSGHPNFVLRPYTVEGPLISQIEQAVDFFRRAVIASPPKLIGARFRPSLLIPEWAFQEAITNAVIHRNYFIEDDIQVRLFDNRIEIESPGAYPGHITPENIRKERFARNPIIQRTLNRFNDAPNLDIGEGVDRIYEMMRESNLYDPVYSQVTDKPRSVQITLYNIQKLDYWDTVSKYLDDNYRITNGQMREILNIQDTVKTSRILTQWVKDGLLEQVRSGYNGNTYYKKPGKIIS